MAPKRSNKISKKIIKDFSSRNSPIIAYEKIIKEKSDQMDILALILLKGDICFGTN